MQDQNRIRRKPSLVSRVHREAEVPHSPEALGFVSKTNDIHTGLKKGQARSVLEKTRDQTLTAIKRYGRSPGARAFYEERLEFLITALLAGVHDAIGDYDKSHALNQTNLEEAQGLRKRATTKTKQDIADRNLATAYMNLSNSARRLGLWIEAVNYGDKAYTLKPTNVQISINFALALYYAGAKAAAVLIIRKLMEFCPGDTVKLHLKYETELRAIPELADVVNSET